MNKKFINLFLGLFIPVLSLAQPKDIDYFVSHAIASSPLLNENRNNLLITGIDSALIVAANKYQVTANGNGYYAPIVHGYGYDKVITNGQQLAALVALNKQVYNRRNLSLQFADIRIQKDSLAIGYLITQQDLKKNIVAQYITVYSDQLQITFNDQLYDLLQKQEVILKKLTQQNVYRQVDYLSFLVTFQQQNLVRQQLDVQRKNDFSTLNYFAGIFDTATAELKEPDLAVVTTFITDNSAFFLQYKIDSLRLTNNKALIDLGYKPRVSLFADAGYQSSFNLTPYKNFGTGIGVSLSVPIYDGNQRRLQYTRISIQERTRANNRDFFKRQFYQQVAQLQQQLSLVQNLESSIKEQIRFLETLIEANGKLLETGDIKMTDYILALNNYITAKNLLVQNRVARYQLLNQLNYWNR